MSKLNAKTRNALPSSDFAEPGARKYPIHDEAHARDALARVAQNGTPAEQAIVQAKVRKKFPHIMVNGKKGKAPAKPAPKAPAAPADGGMQDTDQDGV